MPQIKLQVGDYLVTNDGPIKIIRVDEEDAFLENGGIVSPWQKMDSVKLESEVY